MINPGLKKIVVPVRDVSIIIGCTALLIIAIEAAATVLVLVRNLLPGEYGDLRRYADAWREPWGDAYLKELTSMHVQWRSYVYWRGAPFKGHYTNIDDQGLRKTWSAPGDQGSSGRTRQVRIFMFGGSTMWGTGAQDEETIPSILAKSLVQQYGLTVNVTNFGSGGYVTTQEVISLMRELQRGNIPDLVVFYDGANDTFTTFQNRGIAGLPQNENHREREFNLLRSDNRMRLYREALLSAFTNSATYQVLKSLLQRIAGSDALQIKESWDPGPPERVGAEVARIYTWNMRFVQKLGAAYGFETIFYWQPVIVNKNKLSQYEHEAYNDQSSLKSYYEESTRRVAASLAGFKDFHDISDAFLGDSRPYFIDQWHITGAGNQVVVRRMLKDVVPITQKLIAKPH